MNPDSLLQRIVRHLTLNYILVKDPGLLSGKMGGVLFFAEYAIYSEKPYYHTIAENLLEEIYNSISEETPINFHYGLCGIGWGIEYLIRNQLMDGNTDEILQEIDAKIMERDVRRITDFRLDTGLMGILYYIVTRLESYNRQASLLPFDSIYLCDLSQTVKQSLLNNANYQANNLVERLDNILTGRDQECCGSTLIMPDIIYESLPPTKNTIRLADWSIGLKNGLTGLAFRLISK